MELPTDSNAFLFCQSFLFTIHGMVKAGETERRYQCGTQKLPGSPLWQNWSGMEERYVTRVKTALNDLQYRMEIIDDTMVIGF